MGFEDGGAYALLGPSGCGKTTMLNIMSGLLVPSHGSVKFDGQDMTRATPQERNIAQVFQFPVIYDTMTVAQNLAFPLKNRKVPAEQIKARVGQIAEMLEMSHQLDMRAAGLSADQKQKISLGRGLVRPDVSAVLFDEPLTVIDPHLKWQLRRKLKQIHHELKLTLIYVTHDQVEALTFRRPGGGHDARQGGAAGHARRAVRAAGAHLRRPLHRLAGHELPGSRSPRSGQCVLATCRWPRRASCPRARCAWASVPSTSAGRPEGTAGTLPATG